MEWRTAIHEEYKAAREAQEAKEAREEASRKAAVLAGYPSGRGRIVTAPATQQPEAASEFAGHTPGPWEWHMYADGTATLRTPDRGLLTVLDAVRKGMSGATVRVAFWQGITEGVGRGRLGGVMRQLNASHPDAELIAAAPRLLAERDKTRAECEALRKYVDLLVAHFVSIAEVLPPEPMDIGDGRTATFVDPDPASTLSLLVKRIRRIQKSPDAQPLATIRARVEVLEAALRDTLSAYGRLHDGLSNLIGDDTSDEFPDDEARLTEAMIPDDYEWLVLTLTDCVAAADAARAALAHPASTNTEKES
ncbi:MAG: hypothetical protein K2Q20_05185 [Phycisphaerales bacterium]|nr:hypothetical protein [Phycisphaerales bacterium]